MSQTTFWATCLPNFEEYLEAEIKRYWPQLSSGEAKTRIKKGGVEFDLPQEDGFLFNHFLKIPSRIYIRLAKFKAKNESQLKKELSEINWSPYLFAKPSVQMSSNRSRLYHKQKIGELAERVIKKHSRGGVQKQNILLRLNNDIAEVSLDTSGQLLHKRGYKTHIGRAPIRETTAATLLFSLINDKFPELKKTTLIDPMAGSGTFLFEAFRLFEAIESRNFDYQKFNTAIKSVPTSPSNPVFQKYIASDNNPVSLNALQKNLLAKELGGIDLEVHQSDVLADSKPYFDKCCTWIISNPPHGKRLGKNLSNNAFLKKALKNIEKTYSPQRIGLLLDGETLVSKDIVPTLWVPEERIDFSSGGRKNSFCIFERFSKET